MEDANKINPLPEEKVGQESKENLKVEFTGFVGSLKVFLKEIFDIRGNTDKTATEESIINDIPFKGHTAWILVCSTFIAAIGLNANSAPVIIGAMLISPLMGPILGIGLSVAINDIDTLNRSLINFGVMVVLSVITAFLFFWIFPLRTDSSELLSRAYPDIRDVLIAFFGGLALIIARTKKGTIASVIFGVAIATALMPPLCTAGYGLAKMVLGIEEGRSGSEFFFGALYLFIINTIFIALATYLILKLLRFRMVKYADSLKRKRIAQGVSLTALLVMIPAMLTFYNVFQQSLYMKQANDFINNEIVKTTLPKGGIFLKNLTDIDYNKSGESKIQLFFIGDDAVPENIETTWENKKAGFGKLNNTRLIIEDGVKSEEEEKFKYVQELYESKKVESASKDARIRILEGEVKNLSDLTQSNIPFEEWSKEAQINYENLESLGFYYHFRTDFSKLDTVPMFTARWKEGASSDIIDIEHAKLQKWLSLKMKKDSIGLLRD